MPKERLLGHSAVCLQSAAVVAFLWAYASSTAVAQAPIEGSSKLIVFDFADAELAQVIDSIAQATGRNFIYDDRVRGRVTILSPEPIPVEQAYAVFESVLQVKGFTTVTTPGGAIKVIPVREAKESSIETVQSSRRPPNRDRFVTRLIPLNYIDADAIVETLKPLVSKDAAMAAYAPTNTVILTESASNIRRLIAVIDTIDVEGYKEELSVIPIQYADAGSLAEQVSEIYGAEVTQTSPTSRRAPQRAGTQGETVSAAKPPVRILTDERTNSLLVLAPQAQTEEVARLIAKLDIPVVGGGRIHVYYLTNANAEDLAETLSGLVGGPRSGTVSASSGAAAQTPAIRSAVSELAGGVNIAADPATNALIIQATQEGFDILSRVIEKLDFERPQVSVEALVLEVGGNDAEDISFSGLLQEIQGDKTFTIASDPTSSTSGLPLLVGSPSDFTGQFVRDTRDVNQEGERTGSGSVIDTIINLTATSRQVKILSAPHIITSDNEEAEIRVGDNIPIISSRLQSFEGVDSDPDRPTQPNQSVNIERQDIGVTLRVTPHISEGDQLSLDVFLETTAINNTLDVGNTEDVGVALAARRVENTVLVRDGETVTIGGLPGETAEEAESKVPWLGDIPVLGWLFKSTSTSVVERQLVIFLTPRIIRSAKDLELETIRRREEFASDQVETPSLNTRQAPEVKPVAETLYIVRAATSDDGETAQSLLRMLIEAGYDGSLISQPTEVGILYQIQVGPYQSLREARSAVEGVRQIPGISDPTVGVYDQAAQTP